MLCSLKLVEPKALPHAGFSSLAEQYNVQQADSFIDRLISQADASVTSNSPQLSSKLAAAIILVAFAESHTIAEPINFYANSTVRKL